MKCRAGRLDAAVRIEPLEEPVEPDVDTSTFIEGMLALAGTAEGLPPDLARNHDHYLHGRPNVAPNGSGD